jgi:hypothetical protein
MFDEIISAAGNSIPQVFIFPRISYKDYFIKDVSGESIGLASKSSLMQESCLFRC